MKSSCRAAVTLVLFPLWFGCLIGAALAGTVYAAIEDAQRERRRREEERVTRDTEGYWKRIWTELPNDVPTVTTVASSAGEMEARYFIYDAHERGPVIEWLADGGASVNVRN